MAATDLERIFAALEASGARYLVVGGVAVVLHGHLRFTADLDLVLAMDPANLRRALHAQLQGIVVTVASLPDLIALKRSAGRPQDLEDVQILEAIERELGRDE